MSETTISQQEFKTLKSNGRIYICRSCLDNKNKVIMLKYEPIKSHGVVYGFCSACSKMIFECSTCKSKK